MKQAMNGKAADVALIENELERALTSQTFRRANRMRDLLGYVVRSALDGVAATEARVARELFGKGDHFDATIDPEVRIQYGRLRKKLAEYYAGEGRHAPIVIDLPPRRYNPVFAPNPRDSGTEAAHDSSSHGNGVSATAQSSQDNQAIAVLPFANLTNDPSQDGFCYGLTEELITALAAAPAIDVVASNSAFQFKDKAVDVRMAGEELGVQMILEGSVRMELDQTRVTAKLARVNDGIAIWSDSFDTPLNGSLTTQQVIARMIVESLPALPA